MVESGNSNERQAMHAKEIIEKFGGQSALARRLGKGQSTVSYWAKTGIIPAKWQAMLMAIAIKDGVQLSSRDFVSEETIYQNPTSTANQAVPPEIVSQPAAEPLPGATETSPFIFYASGDGTVKVQVLVEGQTVWASQRGMSEIFGVDVSTISYHVKNVYESGELDQKATIGLFPIVQNEGGRLVRRENIEFYNLDAIISIGYRVNSMQATQFRKWATNVLKSYLIKGFVLDDERLKQGGQLFGKDYFDELLERIREIRSSERRFYQKITDIYAQTSVDYDKDSQEAHQFYAHVQDKLHFAIHGHTSAELIGLRADAAKPHMGLTTWKNEAKGGKVTKSDVTVGKNYLDQAEIDDLNRLVSQFLDFAEGFTRRQKLLTMKAWSEKLDGFLQFNEYNVLDNYGSVKREVAEQRAVAEYEKFRIVQDREHVSDFDRVVDSIKVKRQLPKA